jgi:hypothetical protein
VATILFFISLQWSLKGICAFITRDDAVLFWKWAQRLAARARTPSIMRGMDDWLIFRLREFGGEENGTVDGHRETTMSPAKHHKANDEL